jgi:hypothetical protein
MHFNDNYTEPTSQSSISAPARIKSVHPCDCGGLHVILLLICLVTPMWSQRKPSPPTTAMLKNGCRPTRSTQILTIMMPKQSE